MRVHIGLWHAPAQVCEHLQAVARPCGLWVAPIVGGISPPKQARLLRACPEIVVGTPGRLWELMRDGQRHLADLSRLAFLVLDEADRMVQQGHYQVRRQAMLHDLSIGLVS